MKPKFVEIADATVKVGYRKLMCVDCGATTIEKIGNCDVNCWACEARETYTTKINLKG